MLVQRFLYILSRGIRQPSDTVLPREILAVTFTRKAASEMRDRIRDAIEKKCKDCPEEAQRTYWQQQLKELPHAQIGTIHGFCSSLLRGNPVESDLDPAFTVMEERDYNDFLVTEIRNRLRRLLHEEDQAAVLLCEEYGSGSLQEQTLSLLQKGFSFAAGELASKYDELLKEIQREAACLQRVVTPEFIADCSPGNRKLLENNIENLRDALDDLTTQENLDFLQFICKGLSKRGGKNKDEIDAVKNSLTLLVSYPLCARARSLASAWETYLLQMREYLNTKLQEAGFLSFDGLEEKALDLLENYPDVLAKCRKQYRYIMVDEFQDTNERQRQLVYLLCGGNKDELKDRRLFVVGDAKQSIYRFRGADVSVFARVRSEIVETGGELIRLDDNFRTVEPVLRLCNDLFPGIMGTDEEKVVYYEALKATRQSGCLPELFVQHYTGDSSAAEARQAEAGWLAGRLASLHREGTAYEDMAVLLQTMSHISAVTEALQKRSVPYAVTDGRGFFERTEVRDLTNLFRFAVNPHDDLNLSAVLRSVYIGLSDMLLTRIHIALAEYKREEASATSLWDFLQSGKFRRSETEETARTEEAVLARVVSLLRPLPAAAAVLNLPGFCREIRRLLHPEAILALQDNGEESLANLRKFFRLAHDFTAQKQGNVQDFAQRLKQLADAKDREAAATVVSEGAVQLMTVHKAKGLEFPVVAVPFLDTASQTDKSRAVWHPVLGLGICVRDQEGSVVPVPLLKTIKNLNGEKDLEEKARLLYVAMTRAKDRLILTGSRKEIKGPSTKIHWLNWLDGVLPEAYSGLARLDAEAGSQTAEEQPALSGQPESIPDTALSCLLEQAAPLETFGGKTMTEFSATSLREYDLCPRRYYYGVIENIPPLEEQIPEIMTEENRVAGAPAVVLGTLVHKVLEKYAKWRMHNQFREDERVWRDLYDSEVRETAGGRFDLAAEAETMLRSYLHSGLYRSFATRQRFAEFEFRLPLLQDDRYTYTVTGIIDAVAEQEDGSLEIIDYKSGKPPKISGEDAIPRGYAWQLALYKMALEHLLRIGEKASFSKVAKASLHYLQDRSERTLPDNEYRQEILRLCREIAEKKTEEDFAVKTENCSFCPFAYMCKKER